MQTPKDSPIILHHFDQSPFAEKVRLVFGFKNVEWQSARTMRIMPRPDLMPMTGGYRRTPVMQIGADIYCDTQIIIRELEKRFPSPSLLPPGQSGMGWALGMWTDRAFFQNTVNLVFGTLGDRVPQDFIADREKLRGAKFDVAAMTAAIPQMRDQFRAHVNWIEIQLAQSGNWLMGERGLADIHAYMCLWYVRTNIADSDCLFAEFPLTRAWEQRVRDIGHGQRSEMSPSDALEIAKRSRPQSPSEADPLDPNGYKPGDMVSVAPDDYGKIEVAGTVVSSSAQHIAIRRVDPIASEVVVHFPRAGFHVRPLQPA